MGLDKADATAEKTGNSRAWWLPAIMLLLAAVLLLGGEAARLAFRFDPLAIQSGEVWRLVSGHLVHLGTAHFSLNAAGLALVWYLVGDAFDARQWLLVSAGCVLTMDLGFWFLSPQLGWYVGLSGLLHGFLAAGLTQRLWRPEPETLVLAVLLLGKLAWEQLGGPLPGSEVAAGGPVVVDAHLFGAFGGSLMATLPGIRVRPAAPI